MDHIFDLSAGLADGVRDADGAWRFIRGFANAYASPLGDDDGYGESELRHAEDLLGFSLPASLRRAYGMFGLRGDLTRTQDQLLAPSEVCVDDSGEVLIFRCENQSVAQWGIPMKFLSDIDPPVLFRLDWSSAAERVWQPFLSRVSLACIEMVLSEWMLSGESFADNRELDSDAITGLEKHFQRLPFPDYPLWADPGGPPIRWFGGRETILRSDADTWLWARALSEDGIDVVRQALPGDWLMADG